MGVGSLPGGHYPFKLQVKDAKQLLQSSDGLQASKDYPSFAARTGDTWSNGFDNNYKFKSATYGDKNKKYSYDEVHFSSQQLNWDALPDTKKDKDNPITAQRAKEGKTFLDQLYRGSEATSPPGKAGTLNRGIDRDNDGELTDKDIDEIAKLDGDASTISSKDFDIAFEQLPSEIQLPPKKDEASPSPSSTDNPPDPTGTQEVPKNTPTSTSPTSTDEPSWPTRSGPRNSCPTMSTE